MKKCLRQKCQKEFEPNKPKQVFCSAKCRVYFSRELKKQIEENNLPKNKKKILEERNTPHNSGEKYNQPLTNKEVVKPKKEMPAGLGRIEQMRWLRENQ